MPNSKTRQRQREKPLKELRNAALRAANCAAEEIEPRPSQQAIQHAADEIFWFSNPWCPEFHDAPLPSQRGDLRVEYARTRLTDPRGTNPVQVARDLAASPFSEIPVGNYVIGHPAHDSLPYQETHRAFRSMLVRKGRLKP